MPLGDKFTFESRENDSEEMNEEVVQNNDQKESDPFKISKVSIWQQENNEEKEPDPDSAHSVTENLYSSRSDIGQTEESNRLDSSNNPFDRNQLGSYAAEEENVSPSNEMNIVGYGLYGKKEKIVSYAIIYAWAVLLSLVTWGLCVAIGYPITPPAMPIIFLSVNLVLETGYCFLFSVRCYNYDGVDKGRRVSRTYNGKKLVVNIEGKRSNVSAEKIYRQMNYLFYRMRSCLIVTVIFMIAEVVILGIVNYEYLFDIAKLVIYGPVQ